MDEDTANVAARTNARKCCAEQGGPLRFLGLIEGRVRIAIPKLWEASIKSMKCHSRELLSFSVPEVGKSSATGEGISRIIRSLHRESDRWVVSDGSHNYVLPADDRVGPVDSAAVIVSGSTAYVALYGWPPIPYKLYAIDQRTSKSVWSSLIWAEGGFINYEGQGGHFVEIRIAADRLGLFGVSEGGHI